MALAHTRLILTRPDPENQAWLQALTQANVKAVAWPLIQIGPNPQASAQLQSAWQQLDQFKAAMFVSRPAVQHFFAARGTVSTWPSATRAWCTGPGTRNALLAQGVPAQLIDAPPSMGVYDTEHLWPVVQHQIQAQDTVLLVRGGEAAHATHSAADVADSDPQASNGAGRDWLALQIQAQGAQVHWAVAYMRSCPTWGAEQISHALDAGTDGSVWLFSSSQALANLSALLPQQDWSKAKALATHARIAQRAQELGFGQVRMTQPTVEAVLASIESGS